MATTRMDAAEDGERDLELCRLVAAEFNANVDKLRTWRGQVEVNTSATRPNDGRSRSAVVLEYVFDRTDDATRWKWNTIENAQSVGGVETADPSPTSISGIRSRTAGVSYHVGPVGPDQERPFTVSIFALDGNPSSKRGLVAHDFDPLYFFKRDSLDWGECFQRYYNGAKGGTMPSLSVQRDGDLVTMEIGRGGVLNRYVADLAEGGNAISFLSKVEGDAGNTHEISYRYVRVSGVWVPTEYKTRHTANDGTASDTTEMHWLQNVVNSKIANDEFSLERIGVLPGDNMHDNRVVADYVHGAPQSPERAQSQLSWPVIGALIAAAIIVFIAIKWRRRSAS